MGFQIFVILSVLAVSGISDGRKCWSCMNARSNAECLRKGRLEQCLTNQQYCQNEIRAIAGGRYFEVTKRCKQDFGCDNNQKQNISGVYPFQCDSELPHSVCRCCCGFDACNEPEINCLQGVPECTKPDRPENGYVTCQPKLFVGATCYYFCYPGYKLVGEFKTNCIFEGGKTKWTVPPPTCQVFPCEPPQVDPDNGKVSCTDSSNIGSVCSFTCDTGYVRIGPESTTCSVWSLWTENPPVCEIVTCPRPRPRDVNRIETCTDKYNTGSTCNFECKPGYELVGTKEIVCGVVTGTKSAKWNDKAGTCQPSPCPEIITTVTYKCTEGRSVGSQCTFTCDEGEYMEEEDGTLIQTGEQTIECQLFQTWSSGPPQCKPITCDIMTAPLNGDIDDCTNAYNSLCTFTCNPSYEMLGSENTRCTDDGDGDETGRWNRPKPTCQRSSCPRIVTSLTMTCTEGFLVGSICTITCKDGEYMISDEGDIVRETSLDLECRRDKTWSGGVPQCLPITCQPPRRDLLNGNVRCSNRNFYDSTCTYNCDRNYDLIGRVRTTCVDDGNGDALGEWSNPPPSCDRGSCPDLTTSDTIVCTEGFLVGSRCTISCAAGQYMTDVTGNLVLERSLDLDCRQNKTWSAGVPQCAPITCVPPMSDPLNGEVGCTNSNLYDSTCTFDCDRNYDLIGSPSTTCVDDEDGDALGEWSNPAPTCSRGSCPPITTTDTIVCTAGFLVGSRCTISCTPGQYMTDASGNLVPAGSLGLDCRQDKTWSAGVPQCVPITCVPPMSDPLNGEVECTNRNLYDSTCNFECDRNYDLIGGQSTTCLDDEDGDALGVWSNPAPTCDRGSCPDLTTSDTIVCTEGFLVGSRCTISCAAGQYMSDASGNLVLERSLDLDCRQDKTWSAGVPQCSPITCVPPMSDPINGEVECTNRNLYDSTCTFDCDRNYVLNGGPSSTCLDDDNGDELGEWSNPPPTCEANTCEGFTTSPNVVRICSNGNFIGSVCTFRCDEAHLELIGTTVTECGEETSGPRWNETVSNTCQPITCPDYPEEGRSPREDVGSIVCQPRRYQLPSGRWRVDSTCQITCNEGYQAKNNLDLTTCLTYKRWSVPNLCCVECVENLSLDVVVLIDGVLDKSLWDVRTNFLIDFTEYITSYFKFHLNITFIPYDSVLRIGDQLGFVEISSDVSPERLREDLNDMPFAGSGTSMLGEALRFVNTEIYKGFTPNRVPMVFIVTSRVPDDDTEALRQAQLLRERDIHIRVYPVLEQFLANAGSNYDFYTDLTADEEFVFEENVEDFYYDTAANGLITVTKKLCNDLTQGSQECIYSFF